jgi:uncharacterized RDD family membrane protein YckC
MSVILDEPVIQEDNTNRQYGAFWPRLGALMVDTVLLLPLTYGLTYFNINVWKSPLLMVVITIIDVTYKPLMEFGYGATVGKMALKLRVTDLNFEKAELGTILLRNIFHIAPSLILLVFAMGMYRDPGFESVSTLSEYLNFSQQFTTSRNISYISGVIAIIEAIMLATDPQKRSWHDRIAGTFVIKRP